MNGSLLLAGENTPGVGFRAEIVGFTDSQSGMVGRSVWTDERGDKVFSELKGEWVGTGNRIAGTFLGGTGRYAGATGEYEFQWQYVLTAEDGTVSGRTVGLKGRVRVGATPASARRPRTRAMTAPGSPSPHPDQARHDVRPGARHLADADSGRVDERGVAPLRASSRPRFSPSS